VVVGVFATEAALDGFAGALPLACVAFVGGPRAERVGSVGDRVVKAVARYATQRVIPRVAAPTGRAFTEQFARPRAWGVEFVVGEFVEDPVALLFQLGDRAIDAVELGADLLGIAEPRTQRGLLEARVVDRLVNPAERGGDPHALHDVRVAGAAEQTARRRRQPFQRYGQLGSLLCKRDRACMDAVELVKVRGRERGALRLERVDALTELAQPDGAGVLDGRFGARGGVFLRRPVGVAARG
jgi:hypothetical protein